ncbi:hypothetical protein [Rubritalea tangerina]|uniref:hypothetical protein n=1 Tax=Rubritalea tangerina TaxID=430798 RepID=UPI00360F57DF
MPCIINKWMHVRVLSRKVRCSNQSRYLSGMLIGCCDGLEDKWCDGDLVGVS